MKICIATPFYNMVAWSPYVNSLVATVYYMAKKGIKFDFMNFPNDCYIWRGRNLIANEFMKTDSTDLFFIDNDIEWSIESFINIINTTEPIVGGNYHRKGSWSKWASTPQMKSEYAVKKNENGLIQAHIVASGFVKINKSVFQKLAETKEYFYIDKDKYFDFYSHLKIKDDVFGEDNSFCIRCKNAGINMYLHPDCDITHYGYAGHGGNYGKSLETSNTSGTVIETLKNAVKDAKNE